MLQLQNKPHDGRAKDGEIELSLAMSEPMVGVERMVGRRIARSQSLEAADTVGGHSVCHRTAYRAHDDFTQYYYFLSRVGRKTESIATQLVALILSTLPLPERVLLVIDDSPTKRYGPKVEGADIHHNPTPGPADQKYL